MPPRRLFNSACVATPEEQAAMIAEFEKLSDKHALTLSRLDDKIRAQQVVSSNRKRAMRWVTDRKLLDDTQDRCEVLLDSLITPEIKQVLQKLCRDRHSATLTNDDMSSYATDVRRNSVNENNSRLSDHENTEDDEKELRQLSIALHTQLQCIREDMALLHGSRLGSDGRARLQRNITSLHDFIDDHLKAAQVTEHALTSRIHALDIIDIETVFQSTQSQFDQISSSSGATRAITLAFAASLAQEQNRARHRVEMCNAAAQATSCITTNAVQKINVIHNSAEHVQNELLNEDAVEVASSVLDMCASRAAGKQGGSEYDLGSTSSAFTNICERVCDLLPHLRSRTHVARAAVARAQRQRLQRMRCRAALHDYQRTAADILLSYDTAVQTMQEQQRAHALQDQKREQTKERQQKLHEQLQRQRQGYDARQKATNEMQTRQREAAQAAAAAAKARRVCELQKRLRALAVYEQDRTLAQEKERQLQELRAQEQLVEKAARMEVNSKRVAYRQQQRQERERVRQRHEQEMAKLIRRKEKSLQCFFRLVEESMSIPSDPQRVRHHTVASAMSEQYITAAERARTNCTGFTDEQVMRDPRVRLYHALLEAGLHTTSYGREVCTRGYRVPQAQCASEENPLKTAQI